MGQSDWEAGLNDLEGVRGWSVSTTYAGVETFKAMNTNSLPLYWIV